MHRHESHNDDYRSRRSIQIDREEADDQGGYEYGNDGGYEYGNEGGYEYGNDGGYEYGNDGGYASRRSGGTARALIWVIFTLLFIALIAGAIWVFFFSTTGMKIGHDDPTLYLSAPSAPQATTPFVGVSLPVASVTMCEGDRRMLSATLKLSEGSAYVNTHSLRLVWESEEPGVVSVDQHGALTARHAGTSRVSVRIADDRVDCNTAYCMVVVNEMPRPEPTDSIYSMPESDIKDAIAKKTAGPESE